MSEVDPQQDYWLPNYILNTILSVSLRIPGVSGHPFRLNPDTHSGVFGHLRRRADRRLCE
jgi:hypothetical protein